VLPMMTTRLALRYAAFIQECFTQTVRDPLLRTA
jgi:hypothetical protein